MKLDAIATKEKVYVYINKYIRTKDMLVGTEIDPENEREYIEVALVSPNGYGDLSYVESLDTLESWDLVLNSSANLLPEWINPKAIKSAIIAEAKRWAKEHLHIRKSDITITQGHEDEFHYCTDVTILGGSVEEICFSKVNLIRNAAVTAICDSNIEVVEDVPYITCLSDSHICNLHLPQTKSSIHAFTEYIYSTKIDSVFNQSRTLIDIDISFDEDGNEL